MTIKLSKRLPEIYFVAMWIFTLLSYVLIPIDNRFLQLVYYGIHLISYGTFTAIVVKRSRGKVLLFDFIRIVLIIGLLVIIIFSNICSSVSVKTTGQIMNIICFLEMMIAIYIIDSIPYSQKLERFVSIVSLISAVLFVFLSFSSVAYSHKLKDSLNLGYSNPNTTAIYLFTSMSYLSICLKDLDKKYQQSLIFVLCLYLLYLIYQTDSRACFFSGMCIMGYTFFRPQWKIPQCVLLMMLCTSLVFLLIYSELYKRGLLLDLEILGKPFYSGRESYFVSTLKDIQGNLLIGDIGKYSFDNMHNGALTLIAGCGLIGYVMYIAYMGYTLQSYNGKQTNYRQNAAIVVLCAYYLHSCAEAAMIVGGAQYSIYIATVYWLIKGPEKHLSETK